ncbi:hypothetical protein B7P43_G16439 [Cryptotermes secundus]|uniref:Uncharacterized protein n=1 Tax=Cryptotermes secundus TaxID=105785 RepID=A0A2J7QHB3_9NEOP|nr:hypothetical protein B7P43_G16439 [Cryptotermes secundus]
MELRRGNRRDNMHTYRMEKKGGHGSSVKHAEIKREDERRGIMCRNNIKRSEL